MMMSPVLCVQCCCATSREGVHFGGLTRHVCSMVEGGVMFSKLSSPNQMMRGGTSHPQCLYTASCFGVFVVKRT